MDVKLGEGKTPCGPGIRITLTGNEVARAIDAFLVANGVQVNGPRTVKVNGEMCVSGSVYVDPSGFVDHNGTEFFGRG